MEYQRVAEGVAVVPGAVNIGVIESGSDAILVDSGLDRDTARKVARLVEARGLRVRAVVNTHSHADHFGGNAYLVREHGVEVYASEVEAGLIQYPILEPLYLSGGAYPMRSLRNKFAMGEPSPVHHIVQPGPVKILGREVSLVPLPGHSLGQIGVECGGVLFCADSVFGASVLEKYRVPVVADIERQYQTLRWLFESSYSRYVPSHAEPCASIRELAELNRRTLEGIESDLTRILSEPKTEGEAVSDLCTGYGLETSSAQQWYLIRLTVQALLGYLHDAGRVSLTPRGNNLFWQRV